jgi:hypothetical protein
MLIGKPDRTVLLESPGYGWFFNIKMILTEVAYRLDSVSLG